MKILDLIKGYLSNWLLEGQIKSLEQREAELFDHLREEDLPKDKVSDDKTDQTLSNSSNIEVDEFGCERIPGERFSISMQESTKYLVNPNSHEIIPFHIVEKFLRHKDFYKTLGLKEDFSEASVSADIMRDIVGFYGGSFNNWFEWPFSKQRLMFERSQEECQKGIGKAIKDITTNFVLGDGIGFEYTDINIDNEVIIDEINTSLWKIWHDNDFDLKQYTISDYCIERGEVFIKMSEDLKNKEFKVEIIDPWEITEYLFDPDENEVKCWFRNYSRNGTPVTRQPLLTSGARDTITDNPYIINQYKFNVTSNIVRGRSDIYSVLYWIKIYNDFLKCRSRINRFRSSVAWHKTIQGGTRAISNGATKVQKPFPMGTVLVTDDKTKYEALKAEINASDVKEDGDAFKIIISSSIQIPHHWLFGSGEHTNLATAKNMSSVPKRKFMRRQKELKTIYREIFWNGLKFILGISTMNKNSVSLKENCDLAELKEAISKKTPESSPDEFIYKGVTIKKKYLNIQIPNIDEHNAEDFLRLVNAAAIMRKNALASSHAIAEVIGVNYKLDQELMEREWEKGDYEVLRNVVQAFNQFNNSPSGSVNTSATGDGAAVQSAAPSKQMTNDAMDRNKDGITSSNEEPPSKPIDNTSSTIDLVKSPRGS